MKKKRKNPEVAALTARVRAELEALGLAEPEAPETPPRENEDGGLRTGPSAPAAGSEEAAAAPEAVSQGGGTGAAEPMPTPAEQMAAWQRQTEELRELAPDFDLEAECADPAFRALLNKGLTVKQAFILQYFDRLLGAAVRLSADETERRLTADLRARGTRPPENGVVGNGAFLPGAAAAGLTKRQRAELAERARRGEKVRL